MTDTWCVYRHTTPEGKVYIGCTGVLPRQRWNYGYGYIKSLFYTAVQEFGWKNIRHEIVAEGLSRDEAMALEARLIAEHDATNPEKGYNRATGHGTTGVKITEETRQRLRDSHLGKSVPHTPEWNEKIRLGNLGKKKPHAGVPRSAECRRKVAQAHSKPVLQFTKDGRFVAEYSSGREAEKQTNVKSQGISLCCLGRTKQAGGYVWKFKNLGGN